MLLTDARRPAREGPRRRARAARGPGPVALGCGRIAEGRDARGAGAADAAASGRTSSRPRSRPSTTRRRPPRDGLAADPRPVRGARARGAVAGRGAQPGGRPGRRSRGPRPGSRRSTRSPATRRCPSTASSTRPAATSSGGSAAGTRRPRRTVTPWRCRRTARSGVPRAAHRDEVRRRALAGVAGPGGSPVQAVRHLAHEPDVVAVRVPGEHHPQLVRRVAMDDVRAIREHDAAALERGHRGARCPARGSRASPGPGTRPTRAPRGRGGHRRRRRTPCAGTRTGSASRGRRGRRPSRPRRCAPGRGSGRSWTGRRTRRSSGALPSLHVPVLSPRRSPSNPGCDTPAGTASDQREDDQDRCPQPMTSHQRPLTGEPITSDRREQHHEHQDERQQERVAAPGPRT